MKRLNLAKQAVPIMMVVTAFALMGTGYGHLSDTLPIAEGLDTANLALDYIGVFTNDDGLTTGGTVDLDDDGSLASFKVQDWSSSRDPKVAGPLETSGAGLLTARYDVDVARCSAIDVPTAPAATVFIENGYPGYWCTAWLDLRNSGTISLKVKDISLTSRETEAFVRLDDTYSGALDIDDSGQADIEVYAEGLAPCQEIFPGDTVRVAIHQQVLPSAPQNAVLAYGIDVAFRQSTALGSLATDGECQARETLGSR